MSDRILTQEMLEAFRAGLGRLGHQRAKLEKIQRIRQAVEKRSLAWKRFEAVANDLDRVVSSVDA